MRGYFFSTLIALLLGFLVVVSVYLLVMRPAPDASSEFLLSTKVATKHLVHDIKNEFNVSTSYSSGILTIYEEKGSNTLSNTLAELTQWSSFLSIYSDYTNMSFSLDMYNVSTYLNNGILVLRNDGMEYRWQGDMFYFNHSSANINITIDTNDVLNYTWVPPLENSGDVAVVVTVGNYTSDQKWVKYGTSYIGFFNLTSDSNITINFTESANIIINYTNAPSTFNQTIDISSGIKWMYPIFGDERIDSSSTTNPGWIEPSYPDEANPTKHYGSSSNYNFIVADINNDGSYDALYVDTNNDLDFTDTKDIRFLTNGSVADFSGKAFYTIFANNGNWIEIYKVLAVYASDSSGTAIKPVKV